MRKILLFSIMSYLSLQVKAQCTATITPLGNTTFCQGGNVSLVGSSGDTYQWYLNGTAIAGATNDTFVANTAGSYTVEIDSVGCTSTSTPEVITVNSVPAQPGPITGPATTCYGSTCSFSFSPVPGAIDYTWSCNATFGWMDFMTTTTSPGHTGLAGTSFLMPDATVQMRVTANNACGSSAYQLHQFLAYSQIVIGGMDSHPDISAMGVPICPGTTEQLHPTTHGAVHGVTVPTDFQWYLGSTPIPGATGQYLTITRGGDYSVLVSSNGICPDIVVPKRVHQHVPNSATISPNGPLVYCQDSALPLNVVFDLAGVDGPYSWGWVINGSWEVVGSSNQYSIVPDTTALYSVYVAAANQNWGPCSINSNTVQVDLVQCKGTDIQYSAPTPSEIGISEQFVSEGDGNEPVMKKLSVYPNPTEGGITLSVHLPLENTSADIIITDIAGNTVFTKKAEVKDGLMQEQVSLDGYDCPLFLVKVRSKGYNKAMRLMKK